MWFLWKAVTVEDNTECRVGPLHPLLAEGTLLSIRAQDCPMAIDLCLALKII